MIANRQLRTVRRDPPAFRFFCMATSWICVSTYFRSVAKLHCLKEVPCTDSYDNDDFARERVAFYLNKRKSAVGTEKKLDQVTQLILPLIVSRFAGEPLTILDFGGGTARALFNIFDYVPGFDFSKFSYVLLETPMMCQAIRDRLLPYIRENIGASLSMEVVEEIPASLASPSIVNCGGSIQYVPAYREALSRLASLSPAFFVVSNTPMIEKPTCACRHNMRKRVATWKFNRDEFVAGMQALGYACMMMVELEEPEPPYTHKNGPVSSNASMVFKRDRA